MSEVFLGGFNMGILVKFALNNYFRPIKHAGKAPEQFFGTLVVVTVSAKKRTKKKNEVLVPKRIIY